MPNDSGWQLSILSGLSAHFKQPGGSSKAGTDWIVSLVNSAGEKRILVRMYDDHAAKEPNAKAAAILNYVGSLLQSGWSPDQYMGEPGELVVP